MCIHPPVLFIDSHRCHSYKPWAHGSAAFSPILLPVPIRKKSSSAAHGHTQGFAVKCCLGFPGGSSSKSQLPKSAIAETMQENRALVGQGCRWGQFSLVVAIQKCVLTRHTSSKGSSHSPEMFAVVRERLERKLYKWPCLQWRRVSLYVPLCTEARLHTHIGTSVCT